MLRLLILFMLALNFSCAANLDYTQAKQYLKEERYAEAARVFAYVGAHRRYLRPYCDYYRAVAAAAAGQNARAVKILENYVRQTAIPYQAEALSLLNELYLQSGREREIHPLAAYKQAVNFFRKSSYPEALRLLQIVSANNALADLPEDARYYLARAYMYCAEPDTARAILRAQSGAGAVYYLGALELHQRRRSPALQRFAEVLQKYPDSAYAPQALFNLARYGRKQTRLVYYRRLYQQYPRSRYADDAAWAVGWAYYEQKRYGAAAEVFLAGYALDNLSDHADSLLYWAGKARQKQGSVQEAQRLFALARQEFPARFYGWRAAQQLGLSPELPSGQLSLQDIQPPVNKALREFLRAGAYEDALAEAKLLADKEKQAQLLTVFKVYMAAAAHQAGDYKEAILLGTDVLAASPEYAAILPELWRICYPRAFAGPVADYAQKYNLKPNYVHALIREESLYDELALSPANAYGLMQVIPGTAAQVFKQLKLELEPQPATLFQPDINILLGTFYLRQMLDWFEGNQYLALAAYNAGPTTVGRWLRQQGGLSRFDIDTFVENISYPETRNYVKRVMRGYWLYSTIYPED